MVHAATYCEPANSTKSSEIDRSIYQDKVQSVIYLREDSSRKTTPASKMRFEFKVDGLKSRGCYSQPESLWGPDTRLELRVKELLLPGD